MKGRPVQVGDVLLVALPEHTPRGHEQHGVRPAIVVGLPDKLGKPRFPMLIVTPLTTQTGKWVKDSPRLYPTLPPGSGGISQSSVVLLDHLRAIDQDRIQGFIGSLTISELTPIETHLAEMFKGKSHK